MMSNARCWALRLAVLAIATTSLTGCTTGVSKPRIAIVCLPLVEYSREFQARAAEDLAQLPEGSAIAEMLADYSVMRDRLGCVGDVAACTRGFSRHSLFEPVLALRPIGQDAIQQFKKIWSVVRHRDVAELVRDDVVNRVHGRLDQTAIE